MICPPQPPDPVVVNWIERHQHAGSFALHMIGIPATVLGVVLIPIYVMLLSVPVFLLSALLFIGGFLLQFLGHALDGTEPGEITFLKRQLGGTARPAVARQKSQSPVA